MLKLVTLWVSQCLSFSMADSRVGKVTTAVQALTKAACSASAYNIYGEIKIDSVLHFQKWAVRSLNTDQDKTSHHFFQMEESKTETDWDSKYE